MQCLFSSAYYGLGAGSWPQTDQLEWFGLCLCIAFSLLSDSAERAQVSKSVRKGV